MEASYLDDVLSGFSGYIAADEQYDGPFCILSLVDNRRFRRLMYEVLDHTPTHIDINAFFSRFKAALDKRGLILCGITTDASPLYPLPIATVFGAVPHQVCEFHILKELTHAVLKALAKVRKELARQLPQLPRGRPSKATQKAARKRACLQARIADLFEHRHLLVRKTLTRAQLKRFLAITRGLPQLRVLRQIMDQVYALFDRRCRTQTALAKLARLRRRVNRFQAVGHTLKKLFSPSLEKALVFLDDCLLPSTSNAVERGNRRFSKMQKNVYRVRVLARVKERIALDFLREARASGRFQALSLLHQTRADTA